jgi:hypothetical protein
LNYLKLVVQARSVPLAEEVHKAEALMRLLSGVFYACAISAVAYVAVLGVVAIRQAPLPGLAIAGIVTMVLIATAIVSRFRSLRIKELVFWVPVLPRAFWARSQHRGLPQVRLRSRLPPPRPS